MSCSEKRLRLLIGLTGSVACIKLPELIGKLCEKTKHIDICLIATDNALNFVNVHDFNQIESLADRLNYIKASSRLLDNVGNPIHDPNDDRNRILTFSNKDEWSSWSKRSDPVLHIDLRKWADLYLIAPLDANTLAKLSNGQCNN